MKLYRLIFYMLYKFFIRIGKKDIPERKAVVLISLWDFFYLLIPYGLLRYFTGRELLVPKIYIALCFVSICAIHFYYLVYKSQCLRIYKEFQSHRQYVSNYGGVTILIFMVLPILIPLIFTFTLWKHWFQLASAPLLVCVLECEMDCRQHGMCGS